MGCPLCSFAPPYMRAAIIHSSRVMHAAHPHQFDASCRWSHTAAPPPSPGRMCARTRSCVRMPTCPRSHLLIGGARHPQRVPQRLDRDVDVVCEVKLGGVLQLLPLHGRGDRGLGAVEAQHRACQHQQQQQQQQQQQVGRKGPGTHLQRALAVVPSQVGWRSGGWPILRSPEGSLC